MIKICEMIGTSRNQRLTGNFTFLLRGYRSHIALPITLAWPPCAVGVPRTSLTDGSMKVGVCAVTPTDVSMSE